MQLERTQTEKGYHHDGEVGHRRTLLAKIYNALPVYGSRAFWRTIEEPHAEKAVPLEVLVRCARFAIAHRDDAGRNRILEVIFRRIHLTNECWAKSVLGTTSLQEDERNALMYDLYADLCECVIRAIIDIKRAFWEENFQHCLSFARKHVYEAFMKREGRWKDGEGTIRIPRALVESIDKLNVENELAQKALLTIEPTSVLSLVMYLPARLKPVVLLVYWEGRTEKDAARILGISDRTVRNRLRSAVKILQRRLEDERKYVHV